MNNIVE